MWDKVPDKPLFLLGLSACLVPILVGWCLISCCCRRTSQPQADPAQAAGGEADTDALEKRLKSLRQQKLQAVATQIKRRRRLAKLDASIEACEAALDEPAPPSVEERQTRNAQALRSVGHAAEGHFLSALAYVTPLALQSQRLLTAVERRREAVQHKAKKMTYKEVQSFGSEILEILGAQELSKTVLDTFSKLDVSLLIAAALAPAHLRALHLINAARAAQAGFFAAMTLIVLVSDRPLRCETVWESSVSTLALRTWCLVDVSIAGPCFLVRAWMQKRVADLMYDLEETLPISMAAEDPIQAFCVLLDYHMTTGCKALERIDAVLGSCLYSLTDWTVVFDWAWMGYGTVIVLNTPWEQCETPGLVLLRLRVLLFLFLLLPSLVPILLFFVLKVFGSQRFQLMLLGIADSVDDLLGLGVPLTSTLVQSFLIRKSHDISALQLRKWELKKHQLGQRQAEAEKQLEEIRRSREKMEGIIQGLQQARTAGSKSPDSEGAQSEQSHEKTAILEEAARAFTDFNKGWRDVAAEAAEQVKHMGESGQQPELWRVGEEQLSQLAEAVSTGLEIARGMLAERGWDLEQARLLSPRPGAPEQSPETRAGQ